MRRIFGALLGLTVMVATAISAGDMPDEKEVQLPAPPAARATPAQIQIATKFLDLLSRLVEDTAQELENAEALVGVSITGAAVVDGELDVDEFRAMFKPELLFLRKVCEPSEAEFRALSLSCDASLPEIARQFVAEQNEEENEEQNEESDDDQKPTQKRTIERKPFCQRIQEAVAQAAECQLTPEKWSQYSAELKLRKAQRKRVAILSLVARLDHDLQLSSGQREQYVKLLEANWNDAWSHSLGAFAHESNFMPALPENDVFAILSPAQRVAFAELQYDDDTELLGDNSFDLLIDLEGDDPWEDDESPADGDVPQIRKALESDQ